MQVIKYKGGLSIVQRDDAPDYQCKHCFKPWWRDELEAHVFIACQICHGKLRHITPEDPIKT